MALKRFKAKTLLAVGIFTVCALLLTSVDDDCEDPYLDQRVAEDMAKNNQASLAKSGSTSGSSQAGSGQQSSAGQSGTQAGAGGTGTSSGASGAGTQASDSGAQTAQSGTSGGTGTQAQAAQGNQTGAATGTQAGSGQQGGASQSGTQAGGTGTSGTGAQTGTSSGAQTAQNSQTTQESQEGTVPAALNSISGKNWKLSEVRKGNVITTIDRKQLEADGFGNLFTMNIGPRISGKAAPNNYTAGYQVGANNALTIMPPASTLMASIFDPERIHEKDYFLYLSNVKSWRVNQGKLEFVSSDASGKEVILSYVN